MLKYSSMIDLLRDEYGYSKPEGDNELLDFVSMHTADFIHNNGISTVVLVDTSARNARHPIQKGLEELYPDEKVDFFFLNPNGFVDPAALDEMSSMSYDLREDFDKAGLDIDRDKNIDAIIEGIGLEKTHALGVLQAYDHGKIQDGIPVGKRLNIEFMRETVDRLKKVRDVNESGNVLIFDQCMHQGLTLRLCKKILEEAFPSRQFYTGVVDYAPASTSFKPDFVVLQPEYYEPVGCRYFGTYSGASILGEVETDKKRLRDPSIEAAYIRRKILSICQGTNFSDLISES
jgi:hypothetical protein